MSEPEWIKTLRDIKALLREIIAVLTIIGFAVSVIAGVMLWRWS